MPQKTSRPEVAETLLGLTRRALRGPNAETERAALARDLCATLKALGGDACRVVCPRSGEMTARAVQEALDRAVGEMRVHLASAADNAEHAAELSARIMAAPARR